MSVCPTKAIRWKGSQLFVRENDMQAPVAEGKPLTALLQKQAPMSATKTEKLNGSMSATAALTAVLSVPMWTGVSM